jgi:hypothetical protein
MIIDNIRNRSITSSILYKTPEANKIAWPSDYIENSSTAADCGR